MLIGESPARNPFAGVALWISGKRSDHSRARIEECEPKRRMTDRPPCPKLSECTLYSSKWTIVPGL
jgi:hypothetical protein